MQRSEINKFFRRTWFKALHVAKTHGRSFVVSKHKEVIFVFDGERMSWYYNGQQVSDSVAKSKVRGICYGKLKDREEANDR